MILGKVQRIIKQRFQMFPESSKTRLTCSMNKKSPVPLRSEKKSIFNLFLMSRGYCNFAGMHGRYTAITIRTDPHPPQSLTPSLVPTWLMQVTLLGSAPVRPDTPGSTSHKQGSAVSSTSCETTRSLSLCLPTARLRPGPVNDNGYRCVSVPICLRAISENRCIVQMGIGLFSFFFSIIRHMKRAFNVSTGLSESFHSLYHWAWRLEHLELVYNTMSRM